MATREQVRELLARGVDYAEIGRSLGVTPGQAYLVGTGMPVDGSDSYTGEQRARPGALASAQHLIGPSAENPTNSSTVREWISARVRADEAMRRAAEQRENNKNSNENGGKGAKQQRAGKRSRTGRAANRKQTSEKER